MRKLLSIVVVLLICAMVSVYAEETHVYWESEAFPYKSPQRNRIWVADVETGEIIKYYDTDKYVIDSDDPTGICYYERDRANANLITIGYYADGQFRKECQLSVRGSKDINGYFRNTLYYSTYDDTSDEYYPANLRIMTKDGEDLQWEKETGSFVTIRNISDKGAAVSYEGIICFDDDRESYSLYDYLPDGFYWDSSETLSVFSWSREGELYIWLKELRDLNRVFIEGFFGIDRCYLFKVNVDERTITPVTSKDGNPISIPYTNVFVDMSFNADQTKLLLWANLEKGIIGIDWYQSANAFTGSGANLILVDLETGEYKVILRNPWDGEAKTNYTLTGHVGFVP